MSTPRIWDAIRRNDLELLVDLIQDAPTFDHPLDTARMLIGLQAKRENEGMDINAHCYELADLALRRQGCVNPATYEQLGDLLKQTVEDFIDALDGDDDSIEAMLDARDRADACNGE